MTTDKIISASILRLRMNSPFFATLALFARFRPTTALPTVGTDGCDIFYNPEFFTSLPPLQVDGLLLHAVLHAALLHVPRRGTRVRKWWNVAADIVVNGIIAERSDVELPAGEIRDPKLEQFRVEEIYELLVQNPPDSCNCRRDLLEESDRSSDLNPSKNRDSSSEKNSSLTQLYDRIKAQEKSKNSSGQDDSGGDSGDDLSDNAGNSSGKGDSGDDLSDNAGNSSRPGDSGDDLSDNAGNSSGKGNSGDDSGENLDNLSSDSPSRNAALEAYWKAAIQKAIAIDRSTNTQGTLPAGLSRLLDEITEPQLDWRSYLWRYLVRTPTDFVGFDRRFIGRGLYLDSLEGESVRVFVAVDTSGSIADGQMRQFLGEVCGILNAYPHIKGELYYVDATAYGPYEIEPNSTIPAPVGGGGTSFVPFFDAVRNTWDGYTNGVCIYLTDGWGTFPTEVPELPVLWVVTPGGLSLEEFPFGETVRLLETSSWHVGSM